jgi:membrane fusion protein (multidrug efflux system)
MEQSDVHTKPERDPKAKSRTRAVLIFLIVVAVLVAGVWTYEKLFVEGFVSTDDAEIQGNQALISSQTLGQIRTLEVEQGDKVTLGQILATLDDRTQQAQRDQALNAIEQAKANLSRVKVGVAGGLDNIRLNEVKLQQARSDLDRATAQLTAGILPEEQFEHIKFASDTAAASYSIAVGQQRLAEAEEKTAASQIRSAQAQLETVEANMTHVIMTATLDGVVARKWVMPGDVVQPAQVIYSLFDLGNLWVDANFKETQVRELRVGDPVAISVDAYPGLRLSGRIELLGVTTAAQFALMPQDNTSGNYTKLTQRVPVRIELTPGAQGRAAAAEAGGGRAALLPGMSVEVTVRTSARR